MMRKYIFTIITLMASLLIVQGQTQEYADLNEILRKRSSLTTVTGTDETALMNQLYIETETQYHNRVSALNFNITPESTIEADIITKTYNADNTITLSVEKKTVKVIEYISFDLSNPNQSSATDITTIGEPNEGYGTSEDWFNIATLEDKYSRVYVNKRTDFIVVATLPPRVYFMDHNLFTVTGSTDNQGIKINNTLNYSNLSEYKRKRSSITSLEGTSVDYNLFYTETETEYKDRIKDLYFNIDANTTLSIDLIRKTEINNVTTHSMTQLEVNAREWFLGNSEIIRQEGNTYKTWDLNIRFRDHHTYMVVMVSNLSNARYNLKGKLDINFSSQIETFENEYNGYQYKLGNFNTTFIKGSFISDFITDDIDEDTSRNSYGAPNFYLDDLRYDTNIENVTIKPMEFIVKGSGEILVGNRIQAIETKGDIKRIKGYFYDAAQAMRRSIEFSEDTIFYEEDAYDPGGLNWKWFPIGTNYHNFRSVFDSYDNPHWTTITPEYNYDNITHTISKGSDLILAERPELLPNMNLINMNLYGDFYSEYPIFRQNEVAYDHFGILIGKTDPLVSEFNASSTMDELIDLENTLVGAKLLRYNINSSYLIDDKIDDDEDDTEDPVLNRGGEINIINDCNNTLIISGKYLDILILENHLFKYDTEDSLLSTSTLTIDGNDVPFTISRISYGNYTYENGIRYFDSNVISNSITLSERPDLWEGINDGNDIFIELLVNLSPFESGDEIVFTVTATDAENNESIYIATSLLTDCSNPTIYAEDPAIHLFEIVADETNYPHKVTPAIIHWDSVLPVEIFVLKTLTDNNGVKDFDGLTASLPIEGLSETNRDDYSIENIKVYNINNEGELVNSTYQDNVKAYNNNRTILFDPNSQILQGVLFITYDVVDKNLLDTITVPNHLIIYNGELPVKDPLQGYGRFIASTPTNVEIGVNNTVNIQDIKNATTLDIFPDGSVINGVSAYYILRTTSCFFIHPTGTIPQENYFLNNISSNYIGEITTNTEPNISEEFIGYQSCLDYGNNYYYTRVPFKVSVSQYSAPDNYITNTNELNIEYTTQEKWLKVYCN